MRVLGNPKRERGIGVNRRLAHASGYHLDLLNDQGYFEIPPLGMRLQAPGPLSAKRARGSQTFFA